ncbi:MAG: bifunctional serine/threonine-protein kinase/formylglycine-generating enzyme family protein [Planctomycetota bacterium]
MSVDRELWELFNDVLDAAPEERHAVIDSRCGNNTELRTSLEQLLELHSVDFPQMDRPSHLGSAVAETLPPGAATETAEDETQIGPYSILERIGAGGMGVVYRAEQSQPIRRQVALKVIKKGMDSREVVARFEAERQALAMMNHPSIARIFDAGVTERGSPYFAMEYVAGVPIQEYCAGEALDVDARLQLFLAVCEAVQHAHQKGIIHRDIKPSNVLVATTDGRALPKVIDFGVAKAVHQQLGEQSIHTLQGMLIGTPEYMSPEQASGGSDVDTRSDVYALGVLLYELLADALPFRSDELRREGFVELQRIICEVTPPRPSSRLDGAKQRRISGDLDWIVMKALEKERDQRYSSPAAFANDIRRHLRDEVITAGPPALTLQLKKLLRRNRMTMFAIATVVVALLVGVATNQGDPTFALLLILPIILGGFAVSTALFLRARRAQQGESTQRALAQKQREVAESQKLEAEKSERAAAEHLAEILRLSDRHRLGELVAQERTLWPARPEQIPHLEDWLSQARTLVARAQDHRHTLEALRAEGAASDSEGWRFGTAEAQWRHDLLEELVSGLTTFVAAETGSVTSVEARLDTAATIHDQTVASETAKEAWALAADDIANLPCYGGLELDPQVGLLPLRRDPESGFWEFWHVESGTRPELTTDQNAASPWLITEETGIVLVLLPGTTFSMGAQATDASGDNYDPEADEKEGPVEAVTLDAFLIGRYLVTQGQWLRLANSNPSVYGPDRNYGGKQHDLRHPIENISWLEGEEILSRVSLRLPTEAQWECAARAGSTTPWWTGADATTLTGAANLADRFARENGAPSTWTCEEWLDDGYLAHSPTGAFRANAFGLHDVHGNVFEWCLDPYDDVGTNQRRTGDGCLIVTESRSRIYRGGAFNQPATWARAANRVIGKPSYRGSSIGLRAAQQLAK